MSTLRRRLIIASVAAVAIFAAAIVSAAAAVLSSAPGPVAVSASGSATAPTVYPADGGNYTSMRPTGVGLPQIGESGTIGAGQLVTALNAYASSGQYASDLSTVGTAATNYLNERLSDATAPPSRVCAVRYRRVRIRHVTGPVFRRGRSCKLIAPTGLTGKPAVVLDIDDTSLSNLSGLEASDYTEAGLLPAALGQLPALAPTLAFYRDAIAHHVSVFFVTGRASDLMSITMSNLTSAGYDQGYAALDLDPGTQGVEAYKSSTRAGIEKAGYDIIVDMGDQESDLDGGYADRAFKLPNPFYFIADS